MAIDPDTAKIDVDIAGSQPDCEVGRKLAWLHLSRNAEVFLTRAPPEDDLSPYRGDDTSAINLQGTVEVHARSETELAQWDFRFIQYVAVMEDYFAYAGSRPRDGMITCNLANPPAMPADAAFNYMLDGPRDAMPFMNDRPNTVFVKRDKGTHAVPGILLGINSMDDHPTAIYPLKLRNQKTDEDNYLYQLDRQLLFVSTFVARDTKTRVITPLAYVTWRAEWHVNFYWSGGDCFNYPVKGALTAGKPARGRPSGSEVMRKDLADRVIHPVEDEAKLANAIWKAAKTKAIRHPALTNLNYESDWGRSVPAKFWS